MLYWGLYESAEIRFVQRYVGDDVDVVELGSSLGVVSCQIASQLSGDTRLVCVEANEEMLPTLRRNIANNTSLRKVRCVHGAIDYSGDAIVNLDVGPSNVSASVCEGSKPGRTCQRRRWLR